MSNTIKLKRGSGSDPGSSALSVGEVALRTDNGKLFTKKDDGSVVQIGGGSGAIDDGAITNAKVASDAAIAGSKISPDFGSQNIVTTGTLGSGNLTIQNTYPSLFLFDTDHNDDFSIQNQNGLFAVRDETNSANRFTIGSDGTVDVVGNLDVGAGIDVTGEITATSHIDLPDNAKIKLGTDDELELYHDGTASFIADTGTGVLKLLTDGFRVRNGADNENIIKADQNGAVEIYYDNSKKFNTDSGGCQVFGVLRFDDGSSSTNHLNFGNSADLKIYHDASDSFITNSTGTLKIQTQVNIDKGDGSEHCARFIPDGAVVLYFNGNERFETTSAGATLSGSLTVSGTVDGRDVASDGSKLDGIASGATNVTNNNQLTNGAGYITSVSGQNYNSLSNLPTIPSNNNQLSNGAGYITSVSGQNYNLLSNRPTIPSNNNQLSNGAGYITSGSNRAAQAYVNFTGDGTPSIRDDVNVSSIGDNGTGLYTVNFSSSMPNSSYCVSTGFANSGNSNVCKVVEDSLSTSSFQLRCGSYQDGSGNTNRDFHSVYCSIFAG